MQYWGGNELDDRNIFLLLRKYINWRIDATSIVSELRFVTIWKLTNIALMHILTHPPTSWFSLHPSAIYFITKSIWTCHDATVVLKTKNHVCQL